MTDLKPINDLVESGIADGVFPGAAYAIGHAGQIHINALGYLCISATLFAVWLVVVLFVDRLAYVTFAIGTAVVFWIDAATEDADMLPLDMSEFGDAFRHGAYARDDAIDVIARCGASATPDIRALVRAAVALAKAAEAQRLASARDPDCSRVAAEATLASIEAREASAETL